MPDVKTLAEYLEKHGFAGDLPHNPGAKNRRAVKHLVRGEPFCTFGIQAFHNINLNFRSARQALIDASGSTTARFKDRGSGYIDPAKSATALLQALGQLQTAAKAKQKVVFATGHPGAMVGFYTGLSSWAAGQGADFVAIDQSLVITPPWTLDMIGPVFVATDGCSAWHSHDHRYMEALLAVHQPDLVVADHGFAGAALSHQIPTIGFYDCDDPALPLAQSLGLPLVAVPINDNQSNLAGVALTNFLTNQHD